jgi:RNA polymerase sigma factor for flagellar operon FliA
MSSHTLFEENLPAIERAIARVCGEMRLYGATAEDFASSARIALLNDDCAILRSFEGRSSMATFLTIVVRRLFIDEQRRVARWYASAEAQRRGPAAIRLERVMMLDGRSFAEAAEIVRREHAGVTLQDLEKVAAALPQRAPRPVMYPVADGDEERFASDATAADLVDALDVEQRSNQANDVMRAAMMEFTAEDQVILRLRFTGGASIVSIARALGLDQRPLYRRIESLLARLRAALEAAGIDAASAAGLIGVSHETLDFGLDGKNDRTQPSNHEEGR